MDQTKIQQKASSSLFAAATVTVVFGLGAYFMLNSPGGMSGDIGSKIIAAIEALVAVSFIVFGFLYAKCPAYLIIGKDSFSIKRAIQKTEKTYEYADVLYFESKLIKAKGAVRLKNYAVMRPGSLTRHINIPSFETTFLRSMFSSRLNINGEDARVFNLLKTSLENWQSDHGVFVEPRFADLATNTLA